MKYYQYNKHLIGLILLISFFNFRTCFAQTKDTIYQKQDVKILNNILRQLKTDRDSSTSFLVVKTGKLLLGTPYVAHTIDIEKSKEPLVINLHAVDCTTYVEYCLATALMLKEGGTSMNDFAAQVQKIRYRQGIRDGYSSRLHYFSDWIRDNHQKGIVSEPANKFGFPYHAKINFMSTHANSYLQLKEDTHQVSNIQKFEKQISERHYDYVPKNQVLKNEKYLKDGDIVGLVTSVKGLDIAHVGILVKGKDQHFYLLNASSLYHKVMLNSVPLYKQLDQHKSYLGIMIARPK